MGDALDDLYDQMDRRTEHCKKHDCWYEENGFGCPVCECEDEESYLGKEVEIIGLVEEFNDKKQVRVLRIVESR